MNKTFIVSCIIFIISSCSYNDPLDVQRMDYKTAIMMASQYDVYVTYKGKTWKGVPELTWQMEEERVWSISDEKLPSRVKPIHIPD